MQITYQAPVESADYSFFLRYEQANARTEYLPHHHPWGQAIFVHGNVLEMQVGRERLLTPAQFPIWIPPGVQHASFNRRQAWFRTFNVAAEHCQGLPEYACLLQAGALTHALMEECHARQVIFPEAAEELRLCEVVLDQLRRAPVHKSYLPASPDKLLAPVLQALEANPADNTTLAEWARRVYTTERTLSRRCQRELNMSFSEWRQRLRFLHTISRLERGQSVQSIAYDLGYSSSSALIAMFQQQAGTTPDRYRARLG